MHCLNEYRIHGYYVRGNFVATMVLIYWSVSSTIRVEGDGGGYCYISQLEVTDYQECHNL